VTATPSSTFHSNIDGYDFSTDSSVIVLPDVAIGSDQQFGVASTLSLSNLLNQGVIYSDNSYGIDEVSLSSPTNSEITNAAGATIFGTSGGVHGIKYW
jgi:hypothetical protein